MNKILFINPPQKAVSGYTHSDELEWEPLGLCYLAAVSEREGYDAKVFDFARNNLNYVKSVLKSEKSDILGLSCWTDTRMNSIEVARLAKKINPNIKIIFGGCHASFYPDQMFKLAPIDVVVIGEGEETLKELLHAYQRGTSLSKINGIVYKQNGRLIKTKPRELISDLNNIDFPIYNGLNLRRYRGDDDVSRLKTSVNGVIISSRGCPYGCTFCSTCRYWERRWRARSPENIVEEMVFLIDKYSVNNIRFWDDHFTLDKQRAVDICKEIIKKELHKKITWSTSLRVDCLDEKTIRWMKKAGCNKLLFGVESGSPTILKNIQKGFTVNDIRKAFDLCHKYNMKTNASIMVGNPGETKETIDETISLLKEIKPDNKIRGGSILWVFPNTDIYVDFKKANYIDDNFWLKDNQMPYYTLEHNFEELLLLSNRLTFGLMTNREKGNYVFSKVSKLLFTNPKRLFKLILFYLTNFQK